MAGSTEADNVHENVAVKGHKWSQRDKPVAQKGILALRIIHKGARLFECDQCEKNIQTQR